MPSPELQKALSQGEAYIESHGVDMEAVNAFFTYVFWAKEKDNDIETALKIAPRAKQLMNQYTLNGGGYDLWTLEKFCFENKTGHELLEKHYEILKLESPYVFESYLLYLEKNREISERFYSPKMKQLNKHGLIQAMQDLEDDKYDRICISMPPGTQKALSMNSKVLTPNGFVRNGDLKVGDKVIAANGNISTVLGVYPQGIKPLYDVIFNDGSKCRCSADHLWTVQTRDDRNKRRKHKGEKYRTIQLREIMKNLKVENGKRFNYSIDYVKRIEFCLKDFLIHPYALGVLIGDGCISNKDIRVTTKDIDIVEKVNLFLPKNHVFKFLYRYGYRLCSNGEENKVKKELKKLGLHGKTSIEKFIPKEYLYGSYEQRLWLLRGLMDTDGSATKSYCSYATISEKLADDVVELVHSLGGYASKHRRKAGYRKDKEYIRCNDYFELIIEFSAEMDRIFTLSRKAEVYQPKRKVIKRFITDIRYVEDNECQCIYIDDESHLYITDDYIITHNTTLEKFFCSWIIGKYPKDYSLFFSHNSDITEKYYKGVLDITTDRIEYTWGEIFPDVKLQSTNAKLQEINFGKYKPYSSIQCSSIGSKNAGKVRTNRYLYCDDLIGSIEEALNPNILDKIWRIYGVDLKQRKLNQQVKEVIIMTRWSTRDVVGRIIDLYGNSDRTKVISVPDIDPVTGESNFDYEYNGMSVEFFNDQALTMDEISYKCLFKQQPIEREGLLFPEDKVMRYTESEIPDTPPELITGQCDTKAKGTDYFVLPCLKKYGEYYYCVDCICDNSADYEMQYENSANLIVDNEMQDCEFESNAGGDRVAEEVKKRVEEKGWICNIRSVPTETNKEARIFQCSNWILQHVKFKDKSMYTPKSQYGIMMAQLLSYSVSGKNPQDDVADVFATFALRIKKAAARRQTIIMKSPI